MRRVIAFSCNGETLFGTLDEAPGTTGLLVVSGGNEVRSGAHRGMARLAGRIADSCYPVFRYDRRGVGDSSGENNGFESALDDLCEAVAAFRKACPQMDRIVALGNCDAASTLALFHARARIDALVLANPWVIEPSDELPPAAAIRARYAQRLRDPHEWLRLLRGGVDFGKLVSGLRKSVTTSSANGGALATRIAQALAASETPVTLLLAERDNTAIAFADAWRDAGFAAVRSRAREHRLDSASHSFASPRDADWLFDRVVKALAD